jgi:hypothetical protein
MMTSNALSSFGEVATAPICSKEEDVPAAVLVASTAKTGSGATVPALCTAPVVEPWGPPSSEVP